MTIDINDFNKVNGVALTIPMFKASMYKQFMAAFGEIFQQSAILCTEEVQEENDYDDYKYISFDIDENYLGVIYESYLYYTSITKNRDEIIITVNSTENGEQDNFSLVLNYNKITSKLYIGVWSLDKSRTGYYKEPGVLLHRIYGQQLEKYITGYTIKTD